MTRKFITTALVALIAGCASVQDVDYYTLDMRSSGRAGDSVTLLDVDIRPGEAVSKPEIMIRVSATKIEYYAAHRWAADLREQLSEKLKTEFGQNGARSTRIVIEGELLAFEQVDTADGADARVKMDLRIDIVDARGDDMHLYTKIYEAVTPAEDATPGAVVRALSSGVEAIAQEIAADLADKLG